MQHNTKMQRVLAILLVTIKQIYKQKKMDYKKIVLKAMSAEGSGNFFKKTTMLLILPLLASLGCLPVGLRG